MEKPCVVLERNAKAGPAAGHPAPESLHGFMAGKLPLEETKAVLRHLLTGCHECREITGRIWRFGEPSARERE